ncbi:SDR family NAD(P)-dependent oxidoreductase [Roseateles sp. DAIF2]|uniref:SDR family NAD(P)-dependent oxidoreductase n=1 Tax=Roseateles sp. DAIF2 TaxID=2714952 RepID=UPI0018A24AE3|nr:SDR family NAD(P)-dependent oxidoreductase [Roseateles sp. DAIF2]QPF74542.1 SDR family NAD(P)-dependent oxidoreductase [Roseateles sp. DAIF2]
MKLFIITGSSRGMGEAIARQLLAADHLVLGLARGQSPALAAAAAPGGLEQWSADLADPLPAAERLQAWLAGQDPARFAEAVLINNAGIVTEPGPVDGVPLAQLSGALRVGLEATLLLSSAFLAATRGWAAPKKILNISSGLGRRAMAASAPYCAAKAGMDNLSAAMALDEAERPDGARIVSLAPGIIDTDMQLQLRSGDPARFPDQHRFAAFKQEGQLDSPEQAAAKVLRFLARADFGSQVLADVRSA